MNTSDAKRVLETALICAPAPLPLRELRQLFDDQLGAAAGAQQDAVRRDVLPRPSGVT